MNPEKQGSDKIGNPNDEKSVNADTSYNPDDDHLLEYAQEVKNFLDEHEGVAQRLGERAVEAVNIGQGDAGEGATADGVGEDTTGLYETSVNKPISEAGLDEIQRRARMAEDNKQYGAAKDYLAAMNGLMTLNRRMANWQDAQPREVQTEGIQPEGVQSEGVQPESTQPEDVQSESTQPEDVQSESTQPEEVQPEEIQSGEDGQTTEVEATRELSREERERRVAEGMNKNKSWFKRHPRVTKAIVTLLTGLSIFSAGSAIVTALKNGATEQSQSTPIEYVVNDEDVMAVHESVESKEAINVNYTYSGERQGNGSVNLREVLDQQITSENDSFNQDGKSSPNAFAASVEDEADPWNKIMSGTLMNQGQTDFWAKVFFGEDATNGMDAQTRREKVAEKFKEVTESSGNIEEKIFDANQNYVTAWEDDNNGIHTNLEMSHERDFKVLKVSGLDQYKDNVCRELGLAEDTWGDYEMFVSELCTQMILVGMDGNIQVIMMQDGSTQTPEYHVTTPPETTSTSTPTPDSEPEPTPTPTPTPTPDPEPEPTPTPTPTPTPDPEPEPTPTPTPTPTPDPEPEPTPTPTPDPEPEPTPTPTPTPTPDPEPEPTPNQEKDPEKAVIMSGDGQEQAGVTEGSEPETAPPVVEENPTEAEVPESEVAQEAEQTYAEDENRVPEQAEERAEQEAVQQEADARTEQEQAAGDAVHEQGERAANGDQSAIDEAAERFRSGNL